MSLTVEPTPAAPPPKSVGGKRATLALVVSIAALGFAIYGLAVPVLESEKNPVTPPGQESAAATEALQQRMLAEEQRQAHFAEDIAKILMRVDEAAKTPAGAPAAPAEEIKGSVEDLRRKLGDVEKGSASLQAEIQQTLLRKSRLLSDWSLLQSFRRKLQEGMDFSREQEGLKQDATAFDEAGDSLRALNSLNNPLSLSDRVLRDDLRVLSPQFITQEKMQKAEGFFPKLWVRLRTLVTVRPRDGLAQNDTANGKTLEVLQTALAVHDWKTAMKSSEDLQAKGPAEFAAWNTRLQTRAEAEAALDRLDDATLSNLRGDKEENAAPAAFQAEDEKPAPAPPPAPAHKKPAPAPAPAAEPDDNEEASP
ncbi:MAG: hypothetical protein HY053_09530 [Proteobacteria bacterium]|nr:hypothetical protein [Pseudomonadota bacterium]